MSTSQRASASRSFASPTRSAPWPDIRGRHARLRRRKESRRDEGEVALGAHALDQHGTDHPAPADQSGCEACRHGLACAAQSAHYNVPLRGPEMSENTPQLSIPPEAVWGPTFDVGRATDAYIATIPAADRERVRRLLRGRLLDRPLGHAADGRPVRAAAALPVCRATARLCGSARPRSLGAVAGRRHRLPARDRRAVVALGALHRLLP